jgi:hypothetical protein
MRNKKLYDLAEEYSHARFKEYGAKPTSSSGRYTQKGDGLFTAGGLTFRYDTKHTESKSYSVKCGQFDNMKESINNDVEVRYLHHVFTKDGIIVDEQFVLPSSSFKLLLELVMKGL